jgi:hypothetical protein
MVDLSVPRETLVEGVAGAGSVLVFVVAVVVIGTLYDGRGLSATGALALVGAIAGFILLMAAVGVFLSRYDTDE